FNLAPNYDATLYPTLMTNRGLLLEGGFRYLTPSSEGQVGAAWLDDQGDERKLQAEDEDQRWRGDWQHRTGLETRGLFDAVRPGAAARPAAVASLVHTSPAQPRGHAYAQPRVVDPPPHDRLPPPRVSGFLPYTPGGLHFTRAGQCASFQRSRRPGDLTVENG